MRSSQARRVRSPRSSVVHPIHRSAAALVALVIATALLLAGPGTPSATAHAQLLSSSPADHERLDAAPGSITLRFNEELLDLGAAVSVVDAAGTEWTAGRLEVAGDQATAPLRPGMPEARYELRWQVVSADGHPISGIVPFAVGDAPLDVPFTAGDDADASSSGGAAATTGELPDAVHLVLLALGGAAVGLGALWLVTRLRRRASAPATEAGATPSGTTTD